jgi:hypothetical protein
VRKPLGENSLEDPSVALKMIRIGILRRRGKKGKGVKGKRKNRTGEQGKKGKGKEERRRGKRNRGKGRGERRPEQTSSAI